MMHVFRLLNMAEEIAREKKINVRRPEREFLLQIRAGAFMYEDLLKQAENKIQVIHELFERSDLPEMPSEVLSDKILVGLRSTFYRWLNCGPQKRTVQQF